MGRRDDYDLRIDDDLHIPLGEPEGRGWMERHRARWEDAERFTLEPKAFGRKPMVRVEVPANAKPHYVIRGFRELQLFEVGWRDRQGRGVTLFVYPDGTVEASDTPKYMEILYERSSD